MCWQEENFSPKLHHRTSGFLISPFSRDHPFGSIFLGTILPPGCCRYRSYAGNRFLLSALPLSFSRILLRSFICKMAAPKKDLANYYIVVMITAEKKLKRRRSRGC
jgi:hypothetical protein